MTRTRLQSGNLFLSLALAMAVPLSCASRAEAQHHDGAVDVRVWAGAAGRYVLTDNDTFDQSGLGTLQLKVDGSRPVFGGDVEARVHRWLGIDVAMATTRFKVDGTSTVDGSTPRADFRVSPLLVSLNFHIVSFNAVDIWVGPQIGYFFFQKSTTFPFANSAFAFTPSNTFSWEGFSAGADIGLKRNVALNLAFRWQDGDAAHLTVDPAFATAGLTFRF
jgi:outer membrane protein W